MRGDYGLHNPPTTQAIDKIEKKFKETELDLQIERPVHHCFARSAENIAIVNENVVQDPTKSISRLSQELGLSYGTLARILHVMDFAGNG